MKKIEDDDKFLSLLSSEAFERLAQNDSDPLRLEEPWKTIILIYSAQGIIDNGGFVYFFENDWPHFTPYDEFADAYDRIGLNCAAESIRTAVAVMKIEAPECSLDARRRYIHKNTIGDRGEVRGWNEDAILGNKTVMPALASWIRTLKNTKT